MSDPLRFAAFDFDGTLVDSAQSIVDGVKACWAVCGFPEPDPEAVRRIIGLPWEESIRTLLPGSGDREFALIRNYYDEVARGVRQRPATSEELFPGVLDTLDHLESAGFVLGIVTSRNSRRLMHLLDELGIASRFVTVKTPDHGPGKPAPDLLFQAMAEVGADKAWTVMIGDTTFDILMACNAGTASVGVSWGVHHPEELADAGAGRIVDAVHELPDAIHAVTREVS